MRIDPKTLQLQSLNLKGILQDLALSFELVGNLLYFQITMLYTLISP